ncbi:hypothetical protein [Hymenobacter sp. PAMC 26628]|uniref:hypothetical protein n=1 Tax=Hymenobacter sp. PAMC 26628 TaxID=1484118 RepID=UPI00076FEF74|nr:hypothetical protein [Hymenobacter sp. PAMC 26628]AMJ66493.1 hypothetical protein AXW84_14440 [Hymenobacter sp. PAMC 26628]
MGYQLYKDTLSNKVNVSYFLLREETQYYTDLHRQVLRHSLRAKGQYTRGAATPTALVYYQPAVGNLNGDYRVNGTGPWPCASRTTWPWPLPTPTRSRASTWKAARP